MANRPAFGTYHATDIELAQARAAWGARLIFEEVMHGQRGVVGDRQHVTASVETNDTTVLLDALNALGPLGKFMPRGLRANSEEVVRFETPELTVIASPQGSYGYLYVTVLLKGGAQ